MELSSIIENIENDFTDPFEAKDLTNFITKSSKRIRSKSVLLYLKALNIEFTDTLQKSLSLLFIATEIIHNASLLHDDVLDDAETRRNETCISKKYSSKISILSGDYLLSYAMENLLKLDNKDIFVIFQNCIKQMIEGEFKQYFFRNQIPTVEEYLKICEMKTASLFVALAESVSVVCNINKDEIKEFFRLFGVYFQIMNDLKDINTDKNNGIYTAKDILGIEKTKILLDNYKQEMALILDKMPESVYKTELEDLFKND